MMTDNSLSQQTADSLQSLPFGSIIGAPLKACIEAQAMAAQTSWKFIEEVGLQTDPQTGEKEVVNVSFIFKHQGQTSQVSIPLLTIVPVPYLAVKTVDINFKANITASKATQVSEKTTTEDEGNLTAKGKLKLGVFSLDTQFQASYSSKRTQNRHRNPVTVSSTPWMLLSKQPRTICLPDLLRCSKYLIKAWRLFP